MASSTVDTIREVFIKRDTVSVNDPSLYAELQSLYQERDSLWSVLNKVETAGKSPCNGGITINSGGGKVKSRGFRMESYYMDRINSLKMNNARLVEENQKLKQKTTVVVKDNVEKQAKPLNTVAGSKYGVVGCKTPWGTFVLMLCVGFAFGCLTWKKISSLF
jgi:hypothetical protein